MAHVGLGTPDVEEGLKSYGTYWDDIMDFANKEGNVSQREIQDFFDGLMTKARKDANKAADETVRMATDTSDPFWKGIADAREHSGKFKDPVDDNKMMALKLSFERLSAQFDDDLMTAMNKVAQRNPQLAGDIRAFLSPVNRQAMNEAATTQVAERLAWVLNVRDQSRNGVAFDLWDEAILGPRPLNVTRDILIERLWNSYREMRMATWSNYYANYTEEAAKLANDGYERPVRKIPPCHERTQRIPRLEVCQRRHLHQSTVPHCGGDRRGRQRKQYQNACHHLLQRQDNKRQGNPEHHQQEFGCQVHQTYRH